MTKRIRYACWPKWLREEVAEQRRRDTFGGFEWFPPMTGEEVVAEAAWLLDGGVHPLLVAEQLGKKPTALYQAARRAGRADVMSAFAPWSDTHSKTKNTIGNAVAGISRRKSA